MNFFETEKEERTEGEEEEVSGECSFLKNTSPFFSPLDLLEKE